MKYGDKVAVQILVNQARQNGKSSSRTVGIQDPTLVTKTIAYVKLDHCFYRPDGEVPEPAVYRLRILTSWGHEFTLSTPEHEIGGYFDEEWARLERKLGNDKTGRAINITPLPQAVWEILTNGEWVDENAYNSFWADDEVEQREIDAIEKHLGA